MGVEYTPQSNPTCGAKVLRQLPKTPVKQWLGAVPGPEFPSTSHLLQTCHQRTPRALEMHLSCKTLLCGCEPPARLADFWSMHHIIGDLSDDLVITHNVPLSFEPPPTPRHTRTFIQSPRSVRFTSTLALSLPFSVLMLLPSFSVPMPLLKYSHEWIPNWSSVPQAPSWSC